jgi:hypothetical protein
MYKYRSDLFVRAVAIRTSHRRELTICQTHLRTEGTTTVVSSVKRFQEATFEALKVQRVCSAALLAIFAISYTVFGCVRIGPRFDSRRLHLDEL